MATNLRAGTSGCTSTASSRTQDPAAWWSDRASGRSADTRTTAGGGHRTRPGSADSDMASSGRNIVLNGRTVPTATIGLPLVRLHTSPLVQAKAAHHAPQHPSPPTPDPRSVWSAWRRHSLSVAVQIPRRNHNERWSLRVVSRTANCFVMLLDNRKAKRRITVRPIGHPSRVMVRACHRPVSPERQRSDRPRPALAPTNCLSARPSPLKASGGHEHLDLRRRCPPVPEGSHQAIAGETAGWGFESPRQLSCGVQLTRA